MRLALYQPEIAQNAGAAIRICACFRTALDIIEPCGFPYGDKAMKRAAMDYPSIAEVTSFPSWPAYLESPAAGQSRLVLLSTKADLSLWNHGFLPTDIVVVGQESAGVPAAVRERCDVTLKIPIAAGARSLNVAVAAAIALAEAQRQLDVHPV